MSNKKLISSMLIVTVLMTQGIVFQGCTNQSVKNDNEKEFIIGEIITKNGLYEREGEEMYCGSKLAVDEINDNAGVLINGENYHLKLITVDDESNPDIAKKLYNSLIDKGAQAVVAPVSAESCKAVESQANEDNIPLIIASVTSNEVGKYDNSFRVCLSDEQIGLEAADEAFYHMNSRKSVILYNQASADVMESFSDEYIKNGGRIVGQEQCSPDIESLTYCANLINASGADVVYLPEKSDFSKAVMDFMEQQQLNVSIVTSENWDGMNVSGYTWLKEIAYPKIYSEKYSDFCADYLFEYDMIPGQKAAEGYDAVYVIVNALNEAGNTDCDLQISAMSDIVFDGITGKEISFNEIGKCKRNVEFMHLR